MNAIIDTNETRIHTTLSKYIYIYDKSRRTTLVCHCNNSLVLFTILFHYKN